VAWVRVEAPGSKGLDILERAVKDLRTLLTFDKDFGELAFQSGLPATCGIVLFRLQATSYAALATMVVKGIESRTDWAG
jgi:predicted nuclease of predicted toxin-antitoxin system